MCDALDADESLTCLAFIENEVNALMGFAFWAMNGMRGGVSHEVLDDEHFCNASNEVVVALEERGVVSLSLEGVSGIEIGFADFSSAIYCVLVVADLVPNRIGHSVAGLGW